MNDRIRELLHRNVDIVFSEFLDVFEILEHESPLAARRSSHQGPVRGLRLPGGTVPSGSKPI